MCSYYDLIDAKRGGAMFTRGGAVRVARICDEDIDELISRVDDIHIDLDDDSDDEDEHKSGAAEPAPAGDESPYITEEPDAAAAESPYITGGTTGLFTAVIGAADEIMYSGGGDDDDAAPAADPAPGDDESPYITAAPAPAAESSYISTEAGEILDMAGDMADDSPLIVDIIGAAEAYPAAAADNVAAAPLRPFVEAYFDEIKRDDPSAAAAVM